MRRGEGGGALSMAISFALALLGFLGCFLTLGWPLWLSGAIALALYGAVQLLSPTVRSSISARGARLPGGGSVGSGSREAFATASEKLEEMERVVPTVRDSSVAAAGERLTTLGRAIMQHLRDNPGDISPSQYFLTYWLGQAHDILGNYRRLEEAGISPDKLLEARGNTMDSLEQLEKVFVQQRDGFYEEAVLDTKYTKELLHRTVALQENMMIEEGSTHE